MKLAIVTVILWLCFSLEGNSQSLYRNYFTQRVHERLQRQDPEFRSNRSKFERYTREFNQKGSFKKATIPVVFHILYTPGKPYPSEEQVYSQLDALNADFQREEKIARHPADTLEGFMKKVARMEIEFCLPREGPNGKKADAINYVSTKVEKWIDDDAIKSTQAGGADPWDTRYYLNIWVGQLEDSISGYAQLPGGPAATDGIVIDYRFFGLMGTAQEPYNGGKTLTHLVGSYLNLLELWNDFEPCGDDYVEDTPIHNAPNYGNYSYQHVSTCQDNPVEMTMNFMDNSDDEALYLFTLGQKIRMQAVLSEGGPRAGLLELKTKCEKTKDTNPFVDSRGEEESESTTVLENEPRLALFPNPAGESFTLQVTTPDAGSLDVVIYSSLGAVVYSTKSDLETGTQDLSIPCSHWAGGVYFVQARINQKRLIQRLIVPQQ